MKAGLGRHVVAIAFPKSEWRAPDAARWAKAAGWKTTSPAHTATYWRYEQASAKRGHRYVAETFPAEDDERDVIYVQAPSARSNPTGEREREALRQARLSLMGEDLAEAAGRLEDAYEKRDQVFAFSLMEDADAFADAVRALQAEWGEQTGLFGGGTPNIEILFRDPYALGIRAPADAMRKVERAATAAGGHKSKSSRGAGGGRTLDLFSNPSRRRKNGRSSEKGSRNTGNPTPSVSRPTRRRKATQGHQAPCWIHPERPPAIQNPVQFGPLAWWADDKGRYYWVEPRGDDESGVWSAYRWDFRIGSPQVLSIPGASAGAFPAVDRYDAEDTLIRSVPGLRRPGPRTNPAFSAIDPRGSHLGSVQAASEEDARSRLLVQVASNAGPAALARWQQSGYRVVPSAGAMDEPAGFTDNEVLRAIRERAARRHAERAGTRRQNFTEDLASQFIVLVGPPASGKSWFVDNALKDKTPFGFRGKFPRLMAGGTSVRESDALLREQQFAAAREDFERLHAAIGDSEAFARELGDLWYELDGERRYLGSLGGEKVAQAVQDGFQAYRKLTSRYYNSMRGRHTGEALKGAARAAFEERTVNRLVKTGDTVIVDSAGEDILRTPWERFLAEAKAAGFTTSLVWLNFPLSLSLARQVFRERVKGDRKVPEDQTRAAYDAMVSAVRRITSDPNLDRLVEYRWQPKAPDTEADWIWDPIGPPGAKIPGGLYAFAGGWKLAQDQRLHLQRRLRRPASVSLTSA